MKKKLIGFLAAASCCLFGLAASACTDDTAKLSGLSGDSSSSQNNGSFSSSREEPEPTPPSEPTEGLAYTLSEDETYYTVTGIGTATDTEISIPATYNGKPVTSIG